MNFKKAIAFMLALLLGVSAISACSRSIDNTSNENIHESTSADADSQYSAAQEIKNAYEYVQSQLNSDNVSASVSDEKELKAALSESDSAAIALNSEADGEISIKGKAGENKTLNISTPNARVENEIALGTVILRSMKSFLSSEYIENIILSGEDISCRLSGGAGSLYIEGKNAVIYIENGSYGNIYARNTTAIIVNASEKAVIITLANGSKIILDSKKHYSLKTNTVSDGTEISASGTENQ